MKLGLVFLLSFLAGPVLALSCLPSDVQRFFETASQAGEEFVVVHGVLSFDPAGLPDPDVPQADRQTTRLPARLEGHMITPAGLDMDYAQQIRLELACFGPWCGQAVNGARYLTFLQPHGAFQIMVVDPCYSRVFVSPSEIQIETARACMRGSCSGRRK